MRRTALRLRASLEGLSAESIALIVTAGLVLGTFPVYGCPTVLCVVAAWALRVNFPALQLVNQLSSPLQIALLVPLARLGSHVFGAPATSATPVAGILALAVLHAVAGWFCACVPLGFLLYFLLLGALRRRRPECSNGLGNPA